MTQSNPFGQAQYRSGLGQLPGFQKKKRAQFNNGRDEAKAQYNRGAEQQAQQIREDTRTELRNIDLAGKEFQQLAKFSTTLTDFAVEQIKENRANAEADETLRGLFGSPDSDELPPVGDTTQQDNAEAAADQVSTSSNQIEARTSPEVATAWRSQYQQISQGVVGEATLLTQARMNYGSWMNNYLASNADIGGGLTVKQAIASGDPRLISAAINAGRRDFFRTFGLGRASRKGLMQSFVPTVLAIDSQLGTSVSAAAIKENRDAAIGTITGNAYSDASEGTGSAELVWRTAADNLFRGNTGLSRGEANRQALIATLNGYISTGNVDAIRALQGVRVRADQAGTELGRGAYSQLISEAIGKAENAFEAKQTEVKKDIRANMFAELSTATNQEQRDSIIESAADQLEAQGDYEGARKLRQDRDNLVVDGASDYNASRLQQQITSGAITKPSQIDEQVQLGNITEADGDKLKGQLTTIRGAADPKDPTAKSVAKDWKDRVTSELLIAFGLKKDQFGNLSIVKEGGLSEGQADIIVGQVERDINQLVNRVLETNPGLLNDPIALQRVLGEELGKWREQNLGPNGKYNISDVSEAADAALPANVRQRFLDLAASPGVMATPSFPTRSLSKPQDFSNNGVRDGVVLPSVRGSFNPLRGDKVFTQEQVEILRDSFANGTTQTVLQNTATALGMSPLALLQQQSLAYGMEPVKPQASLNTRGSAPMNSVQGAQQLMAMGIPQRGAAFLAGNIQQESSWVGNRQPWDDQGVDAGGLVSWRGKRLDALEARFGRPVSQITNQEQLTYMLEELKNYPEADRIFRNPLSTDRQLIRASKLFWGYGDEGQRFGYSRQIEQSLSSGNQTSSVTTGKNTGIQITSANDASGEPGSDFVISNGQRGARFHFPYSSRVVAVENNSNWETNLESNPNGPRGYGNYVDLEVTLPNGRTAEVRIAHLDDVANIRVGQSLPSNAFIGTQGRTGSTTGAHMSLDWYRPGSNSPDLAARDWFLNNYLRS